MTEIEFRDIIYAREVQIRTDIGKVAVYSLARR
jgi:hypothetical protein